MPIESETAPSDALREVYERRAELQYATPVPLPDPSFDRKFERVRELLLAELPCDAFLDAGCGDGRYLVVLAAHAEPPRRVVAVDIAERILDVAREVAADAGLEAELLRANLESLPLPDGEFDLVLCTQVIEHLLDPPAGLRELARVLAPGGTLIVTTDHANAAASRLLNAPRQLAVWALGLRHRSHVVEFPHGSFALAGFVALLEETGLRVEHAETFRFSLRHPLDARWAQRALNRLEKALPPHRFGDIVAVVARKP